MTYSYSAPPDKELNRYGRGPFCRFEFPRGWSYGGVYVITVDETPVYVGECEDLSRRSVHKAMDGSPSGIA